jgi:hypothetical protein
LFGYTPHDRSYRVFIFETNTVVESYDVTFNKTAPCPRDVFECAGDKEMENSIFVNEGLSGNDGDKDKPLLFSTSSSEHVPTSTLEAKALQALPLLQSHWRRHGLRGRSFLSWEQPPTFRSHIQLSRS